MLRKKEIYDRIVYILSVFKHEIETKDSNNMLDDNVLAEDLIKDLLNECMGWNLINLNSEVSNFPGIDLGDKERRIGVQVSSTKTSKKITDSLNAIVTNKVDKDYNEIYFFILGQKQGSYSVKFENYETIDSGEDNIWDLDKIESICKNFDTFKMQKVLDILEREMITPDQFGAAPQIPTEDRHAAIELRDCINQIMVRASSMLRCKSVLDFEMIAIRNVQQKLVSLLKYMDDVTYTTCQELFAQVIDFHRYCGSISKWDYRAEARCEVILDHQSIIKNLTELCDLLSDNKNGLAKSLSVVIDGDDIVPRISNIKIHPRFILAQYSPMKMQDVLEKTFFRKCCKWHNKTSRFWQ